MPSGLFRIIRYGLTGLFLRIGGRCCLSASSLSVTGSWTCCLSASSLSVTGSWTCCSGGLFPGLSVGKECLLSLGGRLLLFLFVPDDHADQAVGGEEEQQEEDIGGTVGQEADEEGGQGGP